MSKPIALFPRHSDSADDLGDVGEGPLLPAEPAGRAPMGQGSASAVAERAVVGAILGENIFYDAVIDIVSAADFADPIAAAVFAIATDIIEGNVEGITVADAVSVASRLGQLAPVEMLQALTDDSDISVEVVKSYATVVRSAAAERQLGEAVAQAQAIAKDGRTLEERAGDIQGLVTKATEVRTLPLRGLGDAAVSALTKMAERAQRGETGIGITTGFRDLDALLAGLHGGQFIVLAARPGVGKTALALSLGIGTAEAGNHVVLASFEMKAEELGKRALANVADVDSHALRIGALSESDWEAVVSGAEKLQQLPFDVVDMPSVTLTSLAGLCRRRKREGKLSVLVIDYLQIMETEGGKNSTRQDLVAALSRGLKRLAGALDVPVIALSQLNRAIEGRLNRRPQLSDLRESGAIEQDADVIMFISPVEGESNATSDMMLVDILVEKQREGPTGEVRLAYFKKHTRFANLPSAHVPVLAAA